jgi:signal transduction histidine kinase
MSPFYRRLLLWFCIVNVATLLISVGITALLAHRAYGTEPDWATLARTANDTYIAGGVPALRQWAERERSDNVDALLFEGERNLFAPRPLPPLLMQVLPQLLLADSVVLHPRPELFIASQRVVGSDGVTRQFVGVRAPRPREHLHQLMTIQIVLSLLAIGIVGWRLARGIARPVRAVSDATRRMTAGELSARVDERWTRGGDELAALARDFNAMASRIEALIAHERGVLQDISHELRSPLARLQLNLELARREAGVAAPQLDRAEKEIARLDQLLTEMLALTRLEAGLPGMTRERYDLVALVRARVAEAGTELAASGQHVDIRAPASLEVSGSPALLERAVDNLLSNAIKYGRGAGAIELRIAAVDRHVELSVRDHGPGVAEGELASLFRPFFRGSNAAKADGQGLGLAVVRRIVEAHGGEVTARNAAGGGLEICARLPLPDV